MRTPRLLLLSAGFLVGCDQQPNLPSGTLDKIDMPIGKADSTAGGNTTGSTGTTGDTSGTSTGGVDTTQGVSAFTSSQLLGPVTLTGGTARELLFYIAPDQSLHIIASSDGANGQATVGRRTDWDVQISSPDSIYSSWTSSATEGAQQGSILSPQYMDLSNPLAPLYASHITIYCVSNSVETRTAARTGAVLTVHVTAHSGVNDNTVGWTPPLLDDAVTAKSIKLGLNQTSVNATTFRIYMPGSTAD